MPEAVRAKTAMSCALTPAALQGNRGKDAKSHGLRVDRGAPELRRRAPDAEVRPEADECLERLNVPA